MDTVPSSCVITRVNMAGNAMATTARATITSISVNPLSFTRGAFEILEVFNRFKALKAFVTGGTIMEKRPAHRRLPDRDSTSAALPSYPPQFVEYCRHW